MKTIKIELYKFSELSEKSQQYAIDTNYTINVDYEWWKFVYEDMKTVFLKCSEFDTDRGSKCILTFMESAENTAHLIEDNHSESCDTYVEAKDYLSKRGLLINDAPKDENGDFESEYDLDNDLDSLDLEFLHNLQECYLIMLKKEYEYLISKESIKESIICNEYDFTIGGEIYYKTNHNEP